MKFSPKRIVCLTNETVETLYLLGEQDRIVGVTGYAVRPQEVRLEKPRVSSFVSADIAKILALKPDLVLTFSDLQSNIVAELIKEGLEVHCFNHRDIFGIFAMIETLGALIGREEKSTILINSLKEKLKAVSEAVFWKKPIRVYFEEWDAPMITGIRWVTELIEIAGGKDIFIGKSYQNSAKNRVVTSQDVILANPEVILASWCGKKCVLKKLIQELVGLILMRLKTTKFLK